MCNLCEKILRFLNISYLFSILKYKFLNDIINMKTVFEGNVNGQVFNNVADYNSALIEALNSGEAVDASSNTYTVEDEVCCQDYPQDVEEPDLFPGLDEEQYYMDDMTGDESVDKKIYNDWKEYLENNYKEVVRFCEDMQLIDVESYLEDLQEAALDSVYEDKESTESAIEKMVIEREDLKKKLEDLDLNISIMRNASQLNNMFIQYYEQLTKHISDMIAPEPVETATKEIQPQTEINVEGIHRLLDEIFPGTFTRRK